MCALHNSYLVTMLLSLANIFRVWWIGCIKRKIEFLFVPQCIKTQNSIGNLFAALRDTQKAQIKPKETETQKEEREKSHSIRFKSMKLEIPIIHAMKYDDKPKCAYRWSMTYIGFDIENLFETYMNNLCGALCVRCSSPAHIAHPLPKSCWKHKFIYEFDNITTETYNVRFGTDATNSYQNANRKQKHRVFAAMKKKKSNSVCVSL